MAKIFRISGYLVDYKDEYDHFDIENSLTEKMDMFSQQLHIETADVGEWNEDHPLNYIDCDLSYCTQYFKCKNNNMEYDRPLPKAGEKYRHFKIGKIVEVIAISRHTETEEITVVYSCGDSGIWSRPLDMFMSGVDREKYPEATQKYRFEKVE